MNIDVFLRTKNESWNELAELMRKSKGKLSRLDQESIANFGSLYRSACADLAYARREFAGDAVQNNLEVMVAQSSSILYSKKAVDLKKVLYFLTIGMFASIAQRPRLVLISFLLMMVPWIASSFYAVQNPENAAGLAPAGVESVVNRDSADFELNSGEKAQVSSEILSNNIQIAIKVFVAGVTAGILTVVLLVQQGVLLGAMFGLTIQAGNAAVLWQFVAPHGFLEISCIIVSGAVGLRMGMAMIDPGYRTRAHAFAQESKQALASALVVAISLFFCGILEGSISTSGLPTVFGLTLGISIAVIWWSWIFYAGYLDRRRVLSNAYSIGDNVDI